ncbi:hypothetical protein SAMN05421692_0094 [Chryseobacterium indologenes]|nr:hypothetical protein SAMN05421692_0094 [Chryseobacterium indologenes]SHG56663.1 hypothetical protein SAMN05421866_0848 [Chryseobacterium oranimense]
MILLLSIAPCLVEDSCMDEPFETSNSQQNDDNCNKNCCSPFFNCKTCAGFVVNSFHFSISGFVKQPEKKIMVTTIAAISDFRYSVWHPPKYA